MSALLDALKRLPRTLLKLLLLAGGAVLGLIACRSERSAQSEPSKGTSHWRAAGAGAGVERAGASGWGDMVEF